MDKSFSLRDLLVMPLKPIAKNPVFFVFMYVLGMVAAACTVHYEWKQKLYEFSWYELFLWVYGLAAILALLPKRVSAVLRALFYVVAYTVTIADVYCFVKFDSGINPSILTLIAETDTREAGEFFTAYLSPDIILTNFGWILLILLLHLCLTICSKTSIVKTFIKACERITAPISRLRWLFSIGIVALLSVSVSLCCDNLSKLHQLLSYNTIGAVEHRLTEKKHGELFLPLYRLTFSLYANNLTAKQVDILREVEQTVRVDSCSFTSPNIVFIIGEAYNKYHSQLYGYERPTTPRQLELMKAGKLIPFTDVISPWNLTSYVFKHLMSTYAVGDEGDWCDYPLFCEVFRKAGYHVTFLTNEFLYQAKQEVFDFSGGFFLNDPALSAAQFDARNKKLHVFDEGLLEDYRIIQERRAHDGDTLQRGNLTIFHLIGQHQDYRIRCPKSKMHFTVDDYKDRTDLTNPRWKKNLCNYDNATLYNDSIVTEILRLFKDDDAIVIYMPDHGEEVHSRELPHYSGRMHSTQIVKRLAREEFDIPFWIWASPKYRQQHPDIWQQVQSAAHRPYMTDAMAHLLMYLAGIHCPYYRPDLNILSSDYNSKRPRIIKHQADYDQIINK